MPPSVVDIFAGAGGLSQGFKQTGFDVVAAYEIHPDAVSTYNRNHGKNKAIRKDVFHLKGSEIFKNSGMSNIDVLIGGPPCQGFSTYGKKNCKDKRNSLIYDFFRIIRELNPKIFLIENVPGLITLYSGKSWFNIVEEMKNLDYEIYASILKASDYGVPQLRERLFIIGSRLDVPFRTLTSNGNKIASNLYIEHVKKPLKDSSKSIMKRKVTAEEAIDDLSFLRPGEKSRRYLKRIKSDYQRILRGKRKVLHNHIATSHSERKISLFSLMKPGKGYDSLFEGFQTKRKTTKKLDPYKLCRTVTSSPEDFVHYSQPRILTMREIARLQTFPDNYEFLGPRTTGGQQRQISCVQSQQLGNAVPPFLAQAVAEGIAKMLKMEHKSELTTIIDLLNQSFQKY